MPIISKFFGIVIRLFYDEHNPPHLHAESLLSKLASLRAKRSNLSDGIASALRASQ